MKTLIPTTLAGKVGVIGSFTSVVLAVIGPWIAPYDPEKPTVDVLQEPSFTHPFGTDASGLDIFSVVIAAFRTDLSIALLGVGASFVLGLLLGSISGFSAAGGRIWRVLARIVDAALDVFQSIPVTVFALALTAIFGRGTGAVITAVIFVTTPIFARLIRSSLHSVVQGASWHPAVYWASERSVHLRGMPSPIPLTAQWRISRSAWVSPYSSPPH